ncbi:MAG: 50S ribosomal protein L32e, partial [Candidatus Lokiarchaeota archaeon]|nr:50S ribosomal protein L32e [Candidatus Lokiarchaeota archaeon]
MVDKKEKERLKRIKSKMRKKKPSFKRIESWRYKRVKGGWRAAKGIDSKTRQKKKSGVKSPNIGYRTPKELRGLHPSGLKEVVIHNIKEADNLNPNKHGIKIASKVGAKKRIKLIEELKSRKFKVFNSGVTY